MPDATLKMMFPVVFKGTKTKTSHPRPCFP